jgi:response regulator RpfG family c-di-GMP phosphodiesterase
MIDSVPENPRILLVDDEVNILSGYRRSLRKSFEVVTAESGAEALKILNSEMEIPVIVCDMRMPEMDGLQLLERVKHDYPDMVRIMLTGNADQQTAIDAINLGEIFRFHTKPCSPEDLAKTITEALEYFRLKRLEKDLLQNTLRGAIKALTEVLALVNPEAFGRTVRITELTVGIARLIGMKDVWFLESLAMLSQVGCIILPDEVLNKLYNGKALSQEEKQLFEMHPAMGADVIGKIPRLESMAQGILYQMKNFDGSGNPANDIKGDKIPVGGRILRVVIDFDNAIAAGLNEQRAYASLLNQRDLYDPHVLKSLQKLLNVKQEIDVLKLKVSELHVGMKIVEDIRLKNGTLIINKGHEVNEALLERIKMFARQQSVLEPISVSMPQKETEG